MKQLLSGVLRVVFAVAWMIVTFFPDYGLLWLAKANLETTPILVFVLTMAWLVIGLLLLPLARLQYQISSTALIALALGAGVWHGASVGVFNPESELFLFFWLPAMAGVLLGWFTIATFIWRWARGVMATDDVDT